MYADLKQWWRGGEHIGVGWPVAGQPGKLTETAYFDDIRQDSWHFYCKADMSAGESVMFL